MSVDLVGRDDDVGALAGLLEDQRLVELVGAGGVGKTALAIAAARSWSTTAPTPGGAWLARLEAATTPDEVDDVLLAAFDVTGGEPALFERLRTAHGVLVLDNCEHVVDAAAATAARVLDAAPGLRVLCTSAGAARRRRRGPLRARAPRARRRHRAVQPPRRCAAGQPRRRTTRAEIARALPITRRSPPRDRAGRRTHEDAAPRRDHPPARRSLRAVARSREHASPNDGAR